MATPIPCDVCEGTVATFVVTVQANGDTQGVCTDCFEPWSKAVVDVIGPRAPAEPERAPKRGRKPKPAPVDDGKHADCPRCGAAHQAGSGHTPVEDGCLVCGWSAENDEAQTVEDDQVPPAEEAEAADEHG